MKEKKCKNCSEFGAHYSLVWWLKDNTKKDGAYICKKKGNKKNENV